MGLLLSTRRALIGAPSPTYADKVLGYAPIAYWQLNETAGAAAACSVNAAQNGTAVGVTWNDAVGPDGVNGAPLFDGANDYVDIFTATFDAAFNGATGTAMVWARVFNAGVWTDATARYVMMALDDANNYYSMFKDTVNNRRVWRGMAGAGLANVQGAVFSSVDWVHLAITWSDGANADEFKAYHNGAQYGATSAALNVWAGGGLQVNSVAIGAVSTVPAGVWHGWLAHAAVWDRVLTQPEITALANPAP